MNKNGPLSEIINSYLAEVRDTLGKLAVEGLQKAIYRLEEARWKEQKVLICGNGGSAATANYLSNALSIGIMSPGKPSIESKSLCENLEEITHWAEHLSYADAFAGMLERRLKRGDVLIAISGSGQSQNILNAVDKAKAKEATTIGLTGFDGGKLKGRGDMCIVVPNRSMEQIEDVHMLLCNLVTDCLRDMLAEKEDSLSEAISSYLSQVREILGKLPTEQIERTICRLEEARWKGQRVFTCGNAGSVATASHFAGDLQKGAMAPGKPVISTKFLGDNIPIFTAYANDASYDDAFVGAIDPDMGREDVFIAISRSGNSQNVVNAVDVARHIGATTIGLTGFDGGKLKDMTDISLVVPSNNMEQIGDVHMLLCHLITNCLRNIPTEEVIREGKGLLSLTAEIV